MRLDCSLHILAAQVVPGQNGAASQLSVKVALAPMLAEPVPASPTMTLSCSLDAADEATVADLVARALKVPVSAAGSLPMPAVAEPVAVEAQPPV